ncbi:hypothetical protein Taro_032714 [Colocasia esculenta]|uniref:Uncharacterized protein n=1 Tax=Colocasia esculenta TaxID=4460 RepID=A0A843W4R1_COLES|nr:hypothetical protein [Colocasia esculenta]
MFLTDSHFLPSIPGVGVQQFVHQASLDRRFVAAETRFFFPFRRALFHRGGHYFLHFPLR